ncbi:MAG: glycosyltransferase [Bacteroidota bacterium]
MDLLVIFFASCLLIYAFFIGRNAWWFARIQPATPLPDPLLPFLSILIPARNESDHISRTIYAAVHQTYPADRMEVILLNDHSTDATGYIARIMEDRYPRLRVVDLPKGKEGKKAALSMGVDMARGEVILQTDADCVVGENWARTMTSYLVGKTAMVAGPVQLTHNQELIQRLQALETIGLVGITAGSMAAGKPNMSNGANLGYWKDAFIKVGGYQGIDQLASGDDELLMQKITKEGGYEVGFVKSREAIVKTSALPSWKEIKNQRLRWVSKARYYIDKRANIIQLISYFAFLGFPILTLFGITDPIYALIAFELFVIKLIADYYLMNRSARFFHKFPLLKDLLILQFIYIPYVLWVGIAGNFVKNYKWKDRWVT